MRAPAIVAGIAAVAIVGAIAYSVTIGRADPDDAAARPAASSAPADTPATPAPDAADAATGAETGAAEDGAEPAGVAAGTYIDYSPDALAAASGARVLFFHAPWCPYCRELEKDIAETGVPDGVTIVKVDFDTSLELREKYGVTQQTTTVLLDAAGDEVETFVASADPSVAAVVEGLGLDSLAPAAG